MKLLILFALLFCNTVTINSDPNLASGLLLGSMLSSNYGNQQTALPFENAIMLKLKACSVSHGDMSYNTTTGMIQILVQKASGCQDSKYKELSIHEFLSSRFPGYKSYSIQPGRHCIFIFVVP